MRRQLEGGSREAVSWHRTAANESCSIVPLISAEGSSDSLPGSMQLLPLQHLSVVDTHGCQNLTGECSVQVWK